MQIVSAMSMAKAVRLCPQLIIVASRHDRYRRVSEQVMAQLGRVSPLVEQLSIDEAFLDVSDLPEMPAQIAAELQAAINQSLQLPYWQGQRAAR